MQIMKWMLIYICLGSFLRAETGVHENAFSFKELYGTWSLESVKGNSYATFGEVKSKSKKEGLRLRFLRNGRVYILGTEQFYFYNIEYGKLVLSKHKNQKNNFFIPANHNIDRIYKDWSFQGCPIVKYSQKGLSATYDHGGYQMCHLEDAPQATYDVDNPYLKSSK